MFVNRLDYLVRKLLLHFPENNTRSHIQNIIIIEIQYIKKLWKQITRCIKEALKSYLSFHQCKQVGSSWNKLFILFTKHVYLFDKPIPAWDTYNVNEVYFFIQDAIDTYKFMLHKLNSKMVNLCCQTPLRDDSYGALR